MDKQTRAERVVLTDVCLLPFAAFLTNWPISHTTMLRMSLELSPSVCLLFFLSCLLFFSARLCLYPTVQQSQCVCLRVCGAGHKQIFNMWSVSLLTRKMNLCCGFPDACVCVCVRMNEQVVYLSRCTYLLSVQMATESSALQSTSATPSELAAGLRAEGRGRPPPLLWTRWCDDLSSLRPPPRPSCRSAGGS